MWRRSFLALSIATHLSYIVGEVRRWVSEKATLFDAALKALSETLNPMLRLMLIAEGFHEKRSTTIDMNVFRRAFQVARDELRRKLFKTLVEKE